MTHRSEFVCFPTFLHELMVDPTDAYLAQFIEQVVDYLSGLPPEQALAFGPGKRFLDCLDTVRTAPRVYRVLCLLVYLVTVPTARAYLHAKETAFLDVVSRKLGFFLMGRRYRDGEENAPYGCDACTDDSDGMTFVVYLSDLYRRYYAHVRH